MADTALSLDLSTLPDQPRGLTLDLSKLPDQPEAAKPPTLDLSVLPDLPPQLRPQDAEHNWGLPNATIGVPRPPDDEYKSLRDNATTDEEVIAAHTGPAVLEAMKRLYSPDTTSPQALAAAQNAIAISQVTGMSPVFALENRDAVNQALFGTGKAREKFVMGALSMIPMAWAGGPVTAAPGAISAVWKYWALGMAGFEAEENANALLRSYVEGKAFRGAGFTGALLSPVLPSANQPIAQPYSLSELVPEQASEGTKAAVGLLDMFAKFKGMHAGLNGLGGLWDAMAYERVAQIVPGQKMYIPAEEIVKHFGAGTEGHEGQYHDILQRLGLNNGEVRDAAKYGLDVEVPLSGVVRSTDAPWWGAIKNILRMSPHIDETEIGGGPATSRLHVSGQPEAPAEGGASPGGAAQEPAPGAPMQAVKPVESDGTIKTPVGYKPPEGRSLEQEATLVTNSMAKVESGNRNLPVNTNWGEYGGKFQYAPPTWQQYSVEYNQAVNKSGEVLPMTPENQYAVTKFKVQQWLDQGYSPSQIASMWNAGEGNPDWAGRVGHNAKTGEDYNVPHHVEKFQKAYSELSGQPLPEASPAITRQTFADALDKNTSIPQEQKEAFLAITDARARAWAQTEGRSPDDWYSTYLAGVGKGEGAEDALAQRTSVKPWPEDFPNATIHTTLEKLTGHPDYAAAKAGDADAALRVVDDLIKPEKMAELGKLYPGAKLVPILAQEAGGKNKIPRVYAQVASNLSGLPVEKGLGQNNVSAHTKKGAFDRLLSRANFTGKVEAGQKYVILDDAIAQGGTISELRHYIENNGGEVVAVSALTASKGATVIPIRPETLKAIEEKFGREETEKILRDYDISGNLEALTDREGRHLLSYAKLDTLRVRIADGGYGEGRSASGRPLPSSAAEQETRLEQAKKGAAQFLEDGKAVLHLFETADISTLIHELGHMLRRQLPPEDLAIAGKWAKAEGGNWDRKAEEKFARGFEAYVMEGVAPSAELRSIFQKMKDWLLEIYRSIKNLRVRLNDDIRAVFDRLLSTEAERRANVLYQMGDEYGAAPEGSLEAQALERAGKGVDAAEGKIRQKFERDLRKQAERMYDELPEPRIVRELSLKGLNRESLRSWDDDTVTQLIRRWPGLVKKAGFWGLDEVAQDHGFESDDELMQALLKIPTKAEFVESFVAEGTHEYADDLQLGEIDRLAAYVQAEIDILKESTPSLVDLVLGTRPEGMWNYVEEGGRRVSEITKDTDYENLKAAIRMAARNARSAYAAGKQVGMAGQKEIGQERLDRTKDQMMERALREKLRQKELLEKLKARIAARQEVQKLTAKINKISSASNLPVDYREQIAGILSTVSARQIQVQAPSERIPLHQWVADKEANDGEVFDIPFDILEGIRGKTLRDMTLDELRTIHNIVNEIYTKGKNAGKLLSSAEKIEVELQASRMAARIAEKHSAKQVAGRSITYDGRVYPISPNPGMSEADKTIVHGLRAILEFGGKQQAIDGLTEILSERPVEERPNEVIAGQEVSFAPQAADEEIPDTMRADLEKQVAAVSAIDESKVKMPPATLRPWAVRESRIRRIAAMGDRMLSELLEMETVLSWADGFTEEFGPNWTGIYKTINDGYNNLYGLNNADLPALEEILKPFKSTVQGLSPWANKKYSFPELGGVVLTKMEMMSWALNMGNEGNYNALKRSFKVSGRSLSDDQVRAVVDKLSPEEWEAVVKLGRLVDSMERYEQMTGVYETVTGNRLTKVEGWKVDTPAGSVDGWYYPLIDDPGASYKMEKRFAANENRDLFSTRYNPKSPRSGFTIQRRKQADHVIDVNFPAVIGRFIQDRNRYISLTLAVRDAQKLANNDTWRTAVESYLGQGFHRMVMPWLQDMARPMSSDTTFIERTLSTLRRRATMVHIGLKIITAAKHYPMLTTAIDRVGLPAVAKAASVYMRHPFGTRQFIESRDPFMANLLAKWDRDIGEMWRNFDPERSEAKALVTKAAFTPIDTVIGQVARITWLAAYKKAMDDFEWDERKAIDYAQKAVRDTVGTFEPKDLAAVRRGSELRKLFTMFYPYGATMFQREFERAAQLRIEGTTGREDDGVKPSGWMRGMRAVRSFFWILGIAAVLEQLFTKRRPPESVGELAKGVAVSAANSVPFARDIVGASLGERPYEISPAAGLGRSVTEIAKPVFTGQNVNLNKHLFEDGMSMLGYLFDLPTDQMAITAEGIYNQGQPGYEPWNVLIKPPAQETGPRRRHGRR
ncbi:MAG: hypothetical protein ABSH41_03175 [Syntrophobacteraceae bacterium]